MQNSEATKGSEAGPQLPLTRWQLLAIPLTAILLFLAFPAPGLDGLVWVSLVPLFLITRGVGGRRGFLLGWSAGIAIEVLGFYWVLPSFITFSGLTGFLVLVPVGVFIVVLLYSALIWGILGWLLGRSLNPRTVHAAVAIWVALEAYFPRFLPWHLGGAFHDREWLRQGADILGVSGLSYLVLLVNTLLYLIVEWRFRRTTFPRITLGVVAIAVLAANIYGVMRLNSLRRNLESGPELRIGLIQPFVKSATKHDRGVRGTQFSKALLRQTYALATRQPLDLILWPEGINFLPFNAEQGEDPLRFHRDKESGKVLFDEIQCPLVVGGGSIDSRKRIWNTAAYILPAGEQFADGFRAQLYHKNVRMLFGEKIPFQDYFPDSWRRRIKVGNLEAGKRHPIFNLSWRTSPKPDHNDTFSFRTLICYEMIFPGYVRRGAADVDFLVNLTEDIWYGKTPHIPQHVSVIKMRTTENRLPLVRCTNVGPSGLIDVTGSFSDATRIFAPAEKVVTLKPGSCFSFYRAGGFLFPMACFLVGSIFYLRLNRQRR